MDCKEAVFFMHSYLDGDVPDTLYPEFKQHLLRCPNCKRYFRQLEHSDALVRQVMPVVPIPDGLTAKIMSSLPPKTKHSGWIVWVRKHPAASVAAILAIVMFTSFLSLWNTDDQLIVRVDKSSQVVIQGDQVVVPLGQTVNGNLLVENGQVQVEGAVDGDVVVIDGNLALASTAHIAGEITQVDQVLEWLWFKLNQLAFAFAE